MRECAWAAGVVGAEKARERLLAGTGCAIKQLNRSYSQGRVVFATSLQGAGREQVSCGHLWTL